uniref:Histocompatibility minor 13 n=1 Tax=Vombatus ursinus TaxID=29139 RepID=A0A4X2JTC3_VOMUR
MAAAPPSPAAAPSAANDTARPPSTPGVIALDYGSFVFMALLPIFFGALRSVRWALTKNASDIPETITSRDAARFPIIASCTLLGLYLFFKIFSQEYINFLLSMYFFQRDLGSWLSLTPSAPSRASSSQQISPTSRISYSSHKAQRRIRKRLSIMNLTAKISCA